MNHAAVRFHDGEPGVDSLREAVLDGLAASPRAIPPKFFYDQRGSELFDQICRQPEYYPTRTEMAILERAAGEIAELTGPDALLVELGSGASTKVRLLLEGLRPATYLGVDISRDFLLDATARLAHDYPWLEVHAACADFSQTLELPPCAPAAHTLAFYPGSSIGNFEPGQAREFLARVRDSLGPGDALLIGVDLKKDPAILNAAYNDASGVTAAFNRNLLYRIATELDAQLDPEAFDHHAFYNETAGRVEMHLLSRCDQTVRIDGHRFHFSPGDGIHTENSYKYSVEEFQALAADAGFGHERVWLDHRELFSVHYLRLPGAGA